MSIPSVLVLLEERSGVSKLHNISDFTTTPKYDDLCFVVDYSFTKCLC